MGRRVVIFGSTTKKNFDAFLKVFSDLVFWLILMQII